LKFLEVTESVVEMTAVVVGNNMTVPEKTQDLLAIMKMIDAATTIAHVKTTVLATIIAHEMISALETTTVLVTSTALAMTTVHSKIAVAVHQTLEGIDITVIEDKWSSN